MSEAEVVARVSYEATVQVTTPTPDDWFEQAERFDRKLRLSFRYTDRFTLSRTLPEQSVLLTLRALRIDRRRVTWVIDVRADLPDGLPSSLSGPARPKQLIILQLVANALHFVYQGHVPTGWPRDGGYALPEPVRFTLKNERLAKAA